MAQLGYSRAHDPYSPFADDVHLHDRLWRAMRLRLRSNPV